MNHYFIIAQQIIINTVDICFLTETWLTGMKIKWLALIIYTPTKNKKHITLTKNIEWVISKFNWYHFNLNSDQISFDQMSFFKIFSFSIHRLYKSQTDSSAKIKILKVDLKMDWKKFNEISQAKLYFITIVTGIKLLFSVIIKSYFIICTFCLIGGFGNIISFIIFSNKSFREPTVTYILTS